MFRKSVATLLLTSVSLLQIQPALAQTPPADTTAAPAPAAPEPTPAPLLTPEQVGALSNMSDCTLRGRNAGEKVSTGGAFTVGVTCGLLLGLIGTGIAYFTQATPRPTTAEAAAITDPACRLAYEDAYGEAGKPKKKQSALIGGLIGTVVLVVVYSASGN